MREVRDALFGSFALGDILVGGYPTAAEQRLVYDLYRTPVSGIHDVARDFPQCHVAQDGGTKTVNVARKGTCLFSIRYEIAKAEAGLHHIG